jgi:ribonuclease VapC
MSYVLDASAMMAILLREQRGDQAIDLLDATDAFASSVNVSEAVAKLTDKHGMDPRRVMVSLGHILTEVIDFDVDMGLYAGTLRRDTKRHGLSFADRACIATATELGLPVLTTDAAFEDAELDVRVHVLR